MRHTTPIELHQQFALPCRCDSPHTRTRVTLLFTYGFTVYRLQRYFTAAY